MNWEFFSYLEESCVVVQQPTLSLTPAAPTCRPAWSWGLFPLGARCDGGGSDALQPGLIHECCWERWDVSGRR